MARSSHMMWAVLLSAVLSCDCMLPTREGALQGASAVFVGTVRSVKAVHIVDGKLKRGQDRAGTLTTWNAFKFKVVEALKGVASSSRVLMSAGDRCTGGFEIGQTYLVYAYSDRNPHGFPITTGCDRNSDIERAEDEVKWLRAQAK